MVVDLSFCEPVNATARSAMHIREVGAAGRFYSGGISTLTLCGRKIQNGWDIEGSPVTFAEIDRLASEAREHPRDANPLCADCADTAQGLLELATPGPE